MAEKKSNIFKNTIVLLLVTVVCIVALAVVNQVTRGPIEQAEIAARAEIYKEVYADAAAFTEVENTEALIEAAPEVLSSTGFDGCFINDVLAVTNASGDIEGYVVAATSPNGYGGNLQVAVGIKDGKLTGFEVVSNSETAGLGSKCTEPEFASQFAGKNATILELIKNGGADDSQIDAISGATITSKAVTEAVNSAIIFCQENFGGGIQATEAVSDTPSLELSAVEDTMPDETADETPQTEASDDTAQGTTAQTDDSGNNAQKGKGGKAQ